MKDLELLVKGLKNLRSRFVEVCEMVLAVSIFSYYFSLHSSGGSEKGSGSVFFD